MIDPNLLKVIFWTFSFNMMVPHSLKVPLVELSFFDTGLYKLGSMRYMAEKTSTNVYRSVWVYLCISILFCIFHFQLKVDYFIDYQLLIFSHFRDPCNHAPTMAEPPPAVLGEKAFSGCDAVVDLSFVLLLLSTFPLFCCCYYFVCSSFFTWSCTLHLHLRRHYSGHMEDFQHLHQVVINFGSPEVFSQNTLPHQNIWKSRCILPEYFSQSKY